MNNDLPIWNRNKTLFNNKILPNNFRLLIIGSSGCGKNVLLMKMLLADDFMDYNNLIFYSTTINQIELQILKEGLENDLTKKAIRNIFQNQDKIPEEVNTAYSIIEWYKENINNSEIKDKNDYIDQRSAKWGARTPRGA